MDDHTRRDDDSGPAREDATRLRDDSTRIRNARASIENDSADARDERTRINDGSSGAFDDNTWLPSDDSTQLRDDRVSTLDAHSTRVRESDAISAPAAYGDDGQLPLGTVIRDRFELESLIGVGSMGVVYRAIDRLHLEMLDRDPFVAIKVLNGRFKRYPQALITLQREVRKAQVLAHENIISVYTFDRDGSIAYMTMELLDGKSLSTVIAEHPDGVPPAEAARMVAGMAKALAYAHQNGIVHSDFKPGNVFLNRKGQIKVLDFGVARAVAADGEDARLPHEHELRGYTPAYASVEMLRGEQPVPADDVFALSIVAYELLTGRHPFRRAAVDEEGLKALDNKHLKGLRWSQRRALARALGATRDQRHPDAHAFLKHFTGPDSLRTRALIAVLAIAVVGLIAFAGTRDNVTQPVVPFTDLPAATQQQFDEAMREGQTALGFGDAGVNDALAYFSAAYALHPNNTRAIEGLEAVADRFLRSIGAADAGTQRQVFELLYCQDHLAHYGPVATTCEAALGSECAGIARTCLPARRP